MRLKCVLAEYLLLLAACCSACVLVASGFVSGDAYAASPLLILGVCAVELAVLFALAGSKRWALAGIAIVPVLAVAALLVASRFWDGGIFDDVAGNPCPAMLASMVTALLVFLLTRARKSMAALALLSVMVIGYVQFVFHEGRIAAVCVYALAYVALLAYKQFERSRKAGRMAQKGLVPAAAFCALAALVLLGLGTGVYAAVVAPLNPPTMEIKLIREYVALSTVQMKGVADQSTLKDKDKTSDNQNDETEHSSQEEAKKAQEGDQGSGEQEAPQNAQAQEQYDSSAQDPAYNAVNDELLVLKGPWWLLLVALAIVAAFGLKILQQRKRKARLYALAPRAQVIELYRLWEKRIRRMGLPKRGTLTPREYEQTLALYWDGFPSGADADFAALTNAFEEASYGDAEPDDERLKALQGFDAAFYSNARAYLGRVKYALLWFVL